MGDTGPCGRCSEILYFRGEAIPCPEPVCRGIALRLRTLRGGLEQRLHGVRSERRRHTHAVARAVNRHRHGPRARDVGHPGQDLELRHRSVHADPREDRGAVRPGIHGRHRPGRSSRRLHARDRRPHPGDVVPHRRRGPAHRTKAAGTSFARSCAARCVTERNWGSRSPSLRPCSSRSWRRWATCTRSFARSRSTSPQPLRLRKGGSTRCFRPGCRKSRTSSHGRRPRAPRSFPGKTSSGSTTRSAFQWTSSRTSPRSGACRSIEPRTQRRWNRSAIGRARAASSSCQRRCRSPAAPRRKAAR